MSGPLRESLSSLDEDRTVVKKSGVFTDNQNDPFIELKMAEMLPYEMTPHPIEFVQYYSLCGERGPGAPPGLAL